MLNTEAQNLVPKSVNVINKLVMQKMYVKMTSFSWTNFVTNTFTESQCDYFLQTFFLGGEWGLE